MSKLLTVAARLTERQLNAPGWLYNFGNLLGLLAGLTVSIVAARYAVNAPKSIVQISIGYLIGNRAALLTTAATLVFFASGHAYDRGLASGQGPFWGDLLSGLGAMILGAALMAQGSPLLAATSGVLHATGKFGSAATTLSTRAARRAVHPDLFRWTVLASRVPGLVVAASLLLQQTVTAARPVDFVLPATMLVCYFLWSLADMALLQPWQPSSAKAVLRRP